MYEIDSFVRKRIIELIYENKIKSVHVEGILVNKSNIDEYRLKLLYKPIQLSKKYLELFIKTNAVDYVYRTFIKDPKQYVVIIGDSKIIDFDLSPHAKKQFVRRLLYVTTDEFVSFVLNHSVMEAFEENKDIWLNILKRNIYDELIIAETMIDIIKTSSVLQPKSINRPRDKREIAKRQEKHDGITNRFVSHPFLFIIHDNVLRTVELYSATADVRTANAVTSQNRRWFAWFNSNFPQEAI